MNETVPLNQLVTALTTATDGGKSGAFFITTDQQHSAMVTVSRGTITGVKYRNTRGYDAAASLAKVGRLKYQSAAEPTELPGESALDTAAVLRILRTGDADGVPEQGGGPAPAIDLDSVRQRYIAAIGPIGGALFDEAVEDLGDRLASPAGARQLIERLAEHIDDEAEAGGFRNDVGI